MITTIIEFINESIKSMKALYNSAKAAKVGDKVKCPSCGTDFEKTNYQQAFCKSKPGTECKDYYWNNVTPGKRNNTTRISPASARFMAKRDSERDERENDDLDDDQSWDAHKDY
jgi:hypothetical protein